MLKKCCLDGMTVKKVKKPGKEEIEAPAFLFSANCGFQMTWEVDYMIALCAEGSSASLENLERAEF